MSAFVTIIAALEVRGIINRKEGEQLVEHINNAPQSSQLGEAVSVVTELLKADETPAVEDNKTENVLEAAGVKPDAEEAPKPEPKKESSSTKKK